MPGARNSVSASSTTSCGRCSASTALIWSASLATAIIAPSSTTMSPSSTNSMRPARRAFAWTKRPRTANFAGCVESAAILFSSAAIRVRGVGFEAWATSGNAGSTARRRQRCWSGALVVTDALTDRCYRCGPTNAAVLRLDALDAQDRTLLAHHRLTRNTFCYLSL